MNAMIALVASFVLIETYWNVKANGSRMISATLPVLIETYWNVKEDVTMISKTGGIVLIETYWNVKLDDINRFSEDNKY